MIINENITDIAISLIWGYILVLFFYWGCKNKNCIVIRAPNPDKLKGKILNDNYDDFDRDINFIFEEIALNLSNTFNHFYEINQVTSVTNLFKSDSNFNDKIIVDTKKYNGDEIKIEYFSQNHGYIIFMDNWSPGWVVSVNEIKKDIELVLGSYKAVKIKKGTNKIIFKYKPW